MEVSDPHLHQEVDHLEEWADLQGPMELSEFHFPFRLRNVILDTSLPLTFSFSSEPAVGVTRPFVRQSHPEIAAWPAPPPAHQLGCLSGNVRTPVGGPAPPSPVLRRAPSGPISPSPISPVSQHSRASSRHDIDNTSLLSILKLSHVARESSRNTSRNNSRTCKILKSWKQLNYSSSASWTRNRIEKENSNTGRNCGRVWKAKIQRHGHIQWIQVCKVHTILK